MLAEFRSTAAAADAPKNPNRNLSLIPSYRRPCICRPHYRPRIKFAPCLIHDGVHWRRCQPPSVSSKSHQFASQRATHMQTEQTLGLRWQHHLACPKIRRKQSYRPQHGGSTRRTSNTILKAVLPTLFFHLQSYLRPPRHARTRCL